MRAFTLAHDQGRGQIVAIEFKRMARRARGFAARFASATRGNVAMMFGLTLPIMVMVVAGGIDLHHASTVKAKLQDALDAAALAAARSTYTDDANINRVGLAALKANMEEFDDDIDTASFRLTDSSVVVATARINVKTLIANIVLPPYGKLMDDRLPVTADSEVHRASKNVEVSLVLDITGSMAGSRMTALKAAAKELIDIVVQDQQTPFYSKVALAPYSAGVNVGQYADDVRGPLQGPTAITDAGWADAAKPITSISRANPGVVTATNHGLSDGAYIWMTGVSRMTGLNNARYRVRWINANQFSLDGVRTNTYSQNGSGGSFRRCYLPSCEVVVTSRNHTLSDGDYVRITGVRGMTELNNGSSDTSHSYAWIATRIDADMFRVPLFGPDVGAYTKNTGAAQCGYDGCQRRFYVNPNGGFRAAESSTCVSERAGANDDTDVAPSGPSTYVGRNYSPGGNTCPSATITPLSSDRASLKSLVDGYPAVGSTAGQIGIGWGWYLISPNFGSLWPSESRPGPYDHDRYMKVVIIMTDGEFNTPYCDGVVARHAGSGSPTATQRINCPATIPPRSQGLSPFIEAAKVCEGIKSAGVLVYSVGFGLSNSTGGQGMDTAKEVLDSCATSPQHVYMAASGSDLQDAFRAIGREITRLRISR